MVFGRVFVTNVRRVVIRNRPSRAQSFDQVDLFDISSNKKILGLDCVSQMKQNK